MAMPRSHTRLAPYLLLLLIPAPGARGIPQAAAPSEIGLASAETRDARLEELKEVLAKGRAHQEAGETAEARALLAERITDELLRGLSPEADASVLAPLDELAEALVAREVSVRLRRERLAGCERTLPSDDPARIEATEQLYLALSNAGDYRAAVGFLEQVHDARSRLLPVDDPDLLKTKLRLGGARRRARDLEGALQLQEEVVARYSDLPADDFRLLQAKFAASITLRELGDLDGALALQREVHAGYARTLPPDADDLFRIKEALANTLGDRGDLEDRRDLLEEVLAGRVRIHDPSDILVLSAKINLAGARFETDDLEGARVLLEPILELPETVLSADHPYRVGAMNNLAGVYSRTGDLESEVTLRKRVLAGRERHLPPEHPQVVSDKRQLGVALRELGDPHGALELLEEAHDVLQVALPPEHPVLLGAKGSLAITRHDLGDEEGALVLFEDVLEARERTLPADDPLLIKAKMNVGLACSYLGDSERARLLLAEVHATQERLLPQGHPDRLMAETNVAITYSAMGEYGRAREMFANVHEQLEVTLPDDHPDRALSVFNLAVATRLVGDLEGALPLFQQAHARRDRILPPGHSDLLKAKASLAVAHARNGDVEEAQTVAYSLLEGQLGVARSLAVAAPRAARARARVELDRLTGSVLGSGAIAGDDELLWTVLESLRSVSTSSSRAAVAASRVPELADVRRRVSQARRALNSLVLSPPAEAEDLEAWRTELFARSEERDALERELRRELESRRLLPGPLSPQSVAQGLQEGEALVSYWRYQLKPRASEEVSADDLLLAFVVTPHAPVRRIELGGVTPVEDLVERWRASLGQPLRTGRSNGAGASTDRGFVVGGAVPSADESELARQLRARLLDPVQAALGAREPSTLHVVLDDLLHLVPLDALLDEEGRRLGETVRVRNQVSAARFVGSRPAPRDVGTLVAVGGVDFDFTPDGAQDTAGGADGASVEPAGSEPGAGDRGAVGALAPLPQTAVEVEALVQLFDRFASDREPEVLRGAEATQVALRELAPRARYLHVATHGWFAPEVFRSSSESGAATDASVFARAQDMVTGFAPDTLCGIALAGANHAAANGLGAEGILTAEELATLDLSHCELAVLSACETNVGLRRAGQGMHSLQAALQAAGARTTVTSLWAVDDAATRRLMESFYAQLWDEGRSATDALWKAKELLQEEGRPVRDWAGWVLTGG